MQRVRDYLGGKGVAVDLLMLPSQSRRTKSWDGVVFV